MNTQFAYHNVSVSGLPGAGSSTLAKKISETLGWTCFSGGDFMRQYAIEQGLFDANGKVHHDASVYSDEFDRQVDFQIRKSFQNESHRVVDSWLSGFMAQQVPGVLKVLVVCSEDAVRIDRVVNRDDISIESAKQHVFQREQKNLEKWRRLYPQEWFDWVVNAGNCSADKPIYFWYPQLYDLVLDTFALSREQTLQKVLDHLIHK